MPQISTHPAGTATWYDLTTGKPEETKRFYGELFGWTFHDGGPQFGNYHIVNKGDLPVAGFMPKTPEMSQMPSVWTVYFGSQDAKADAERIQQAGGTIVSDAMQVGPLGVMLIAADPTGAVFGLWQPLEFQGAALVNEAGSMAWQDVYTRDADKARDFYAGLLGASSETMSGDGMTYYILKHGDFSVGGVAQMSEQQFPAEVPPHWMPYFAVENADTALKVAQANGGKVIAPPFPTPYGLIAVLSDPDGANFSVVQMAE